MFMANIIIAFLLIGHRAAPLLYRHVNNDDGDNDDSHTHQDATQRPNVVRLPRKIALRFLNPANG